MSWLRGSPLRQSFKRGRATLDSSTIECDPKACFDSFRKHWQQAYDVMQKSNKRPSHEDVCGVVLQLDHMVTLLLVELHNSNKLKLQNQNVNAPCLEYALSENLLDKLYEWGTTTGRYSDAVRLELLKLFELLVSHSRHQLLVHEPFLRPLLKLLGSSQDEIYPPDVEKRLVILLNQLCVLLMQNVDLLDLFFFSTSQHQQHGKANFIIFSLLVPFVHREGSIGHQARDALLLCMSLSQKNSNVGEYIAKQSSICPVLVTGLGGLYSRLPNVLEISTPDWHRITPDDVTEIKELTPFMNSLEFINAVAQVAHPLIREQLLEYMYRGFLIPVLGSTLLQTNVDSQISAMAYLDLIVRAVTEPGLLEVFIKFLLDDGVFDNQRMLDILVERLNTSDSRLCVVTLALFDTLLSLNNENLVVALVLKYLLPCHHVPLAHKRKINEVEPYLQASEYFFTLSPEIMKTSHALASAQNDENSSSLVPNAANSWNNYGLNITDSLYADYYAYTFEAHHKIAQCKKIVDRWHNKYQKYQRRRESNSNPDQTLNNETKKTISSQKVQMIKQILEEIDNVGLSTPSPLSASSDPEARNKLHDSLQSIGESSGYESFRYRPDDDEQSEESETLATSKIEDLSCSSSSKCPVGEPWKISSQKIEDTLILEAAEDLFTAGTVNLGSFIAAIWGKLQTFTSNSVYINIHLTGLISRLARFPISVLHTILIRPDIPTTSDVPSFHQVLKILKQQIDAELGNTEPSLEYVDIARTYLVEREHRLINARKNAIDANKNGTRNMNANSQQLQLTPTSSYDPFNRGERSKKSISSTLTTLFRRPGSAVQTATSGLTQIFEFFTGSPSITNGRPIAERRDSNQEPTSIESTNSPFSSLTSTLGTMAQTPNTSVTDREQNLAICAVLLDEWLKELSAISQEQYVVMLSANDLPLRRKQVAL
ncbi:FHIP family protein AAEL005291 isoform X2 [Culicoides brevitarsis]|uniref:FHIP family protein AAEL005291 isoform X2 n=1 Tax=Culicoides brevitarsis TaxID=469753 RepID=UPI00307CAFDE